MAWLGSIIEDTVNAFIESDEAKKLITEQLEARIFENARKAVNNPNPNTPRRRYQIQTDGSCIEIWPAGIYMEIISGEEKRFDERTTKYSPEQWTDFCKCMSVIEPDKPWMDICQPGMNTKSN